MGKQAQLVSNFNTALESYRTAETWFDNPDIPQAEKELHQPKLIKILKDCAGAETALRAEGVKLTREQLRHGIK